MQFKITPIAPDKMTWVVKADGKEIKPQLLEIESPYGRFELGLRPEGFHGWAFKPSDGGVMTVPWAKMPDGEILVGLVHEHRPNMGPVKTLSPPGGFVDAGESREQAQRRESVEEGGLDTGGAVPLPGLPVNSDRLYLVQDATKDEGMHMYHIEVAFDRLEQVGPSLWRPKKDVIRHKKESDLYFHPWREAVDLSADALGLAAIAKLMTILI